MRALIISLNFNPGHVSHLMASYRQCEELGYESVYYINHEFIHFLPQRSRIVTDTEDSSPKADIALFLFPSQKNIFLIRKLKKQGAKIVYIFHEPLAPINVYRKAGFSDKYLLKLWIVDHISALTVKWSNIVLLPSRKAVNYYEKNHLYKNPDYHYLPLMYCDEREERHLKLPRVYFSYIGTIAADHSFREYLEFVKWAVEEDRLDGVNFLIATKSEFDVPASLRDSKRVIIHKGKPMTDEEINAYYASSIAVWNAYIRTTQSGVLAKSFMFGSPVVVLRSNLNEFTIDGENVVAIDDNTDKKQIEKAVSEIMRNFGHFSMYTRQKFENTFYYRVYNQMFKDLINDKKQTVELLKV